MSTESTESTESTDSTPPLSSPSPSKKSSTTTWIVIGAVLVLLCLCCVVLAALGYWLYSTGKLDFLGGGLNPDAAPRSGAISLRAGFLPDPYTATTTSGGSVDASSQNLGINCNGFAAREPNFTLNWSGSSGGMSIFFVSDIGQDTTLLVRSPQGTWYCNDDSGFGGLDPMVEISNPAVGEYDIWVGSLMQGETGSGTVFVTELSFNPSNPYGYNNNNDNTTGGSLEVGGSPTYGEIDLSSGFGPDPFTTSATSGGPVDVYNQDLGSGCTGYAATSPDFRLNWTGAADQLDIFFLSDGDTTLVINDPNGNWYCNDDSAFGYDPQVTINNPRQGQYDIWIGSYSSGNAYPGTLYISGQGSNPGEFEGGGLPDEPVGELDSTLEPTYGSTELAPGFSPDPFTVSVTSGGDLDVWMMNINAGGYADSAPTYRLYWSGSTEQLNIGFVADGGGDTTMIVLDPEGTYWYNDDSNGSLNPTVRVNDPLPGEYNIWVASYQAGQRRPGTLSITDTPAPRPDFSLSPVNGSANLQGGFSPDPRSVDVTTGGPVDVLGSGIGPCGGWTTAAPSYRVNFTGSASLLRFFFIAEDQGDSTMIVYTPDGEWICNDDSGFTDRDGNPYNPMIDITSPAPGTYNIWVASYSSGVSHPGKLYVTGQDRNPSNTP